MSKIRIYQLSKEINIPSKEIITKLNDKLEGSDIKIKSHMSMISQEDAAFIRNAYAPKPEKQEETSAPKKEKKSKQRNKKPNNKKNRSRNKDHDKKKSTSSEVVKIGESVTVIDFAQNIGEPVTAVITKLISLGIMANQNQEIDFDTAALIADEFGKKIEKQESENIDDAFDLDYEDDEKDLKLRPPVIAVMGHVDHGKTSLLDRIRKTHVTQGEAGGITQHIGAYTARINNHKIVFLDTPGHEAFTAMRSRGAQVTDISILVVAADDGVMPQTIEAINHSKAAGVPIIVAVNKIDRPESNIERVKQELADHGLMPDDWGGDAIIVPVSAKTGEGIDELLEMILLVAEMEELKANPSRKAVGTVIEAQLDKGRGPTATVLVEKGTLQQGDMIVSGQAYGRIRAMFNDNGKQIKKAGPSTPVLILGLSEVPEAGDKFYEMDDEKSARAYSDRVKEVVKAEKNKHTTNVSLDELFSHINEGDLKELSIIVKTDVRGTIDAVSQSLLKLSNEEVKVKIIHGGVGGVTESDVILASASNAIIIGFNVRPTQTALDLASHENIEIRTYRVIYDAINDIQDAIQGMLKPKFVEKVLGRADVRDTFKIPGVGVVAGIYVTNGKIMRNATIRLLRNDILVFEGSILSLKRFKDDVKELNQGYEGGLGFENFNDVKIGDSIEAYIMEEVSE